MSDNQIIKINLGDVVYRADGLRGKVIAQGANSGYIASYEEATMEYFNSKDLSKFWLIGKTMLGNKADATPLEDKVKKIQKQIATLHEKEAVLRKQIFRLKNQMYESWEAEKLAMQEERTEENRNTKEQSPKEND